MSKRFPKLYQIGIRFPKTVLLLSLVLVGLAFMESKKLNIESDLTALLPKNTESVQNLNTLKSYFGGSSYLFVTVEARDPGIASDFADDFAARIEAHPSVLYVESRRPAEYFKKRQWLYLDLDDLKEMERRIDQSKELEKQGISPFFTEFMDLTDPGTLPDLTFRDIIDKYKKRIGSDLNDRTADEKGSFIVLKVKAKDNAEDIDSSRQLIAEIKTLEQDLKKTPAYHSVSVGYTGDYETKIEQVDQITHEMGVVSAIVALLLFAILLAYFRHINGAVLVGIPLVISLLWTGGLVYLLLGHLNVVTGFGAAILGGLGSDYGIYLLSRFYQEKVAGHDFITCCNRAFANTGKATRASMITTVGSFVALVFSHFGVFREFGIVGALGVISTYVAMMLIIPSLLALWNAHKPMGLRPSTPLKKETSFPFSGIFKGQRPLNHRRYSFLIKGFYSTPMARVSIAFIILLCLVSAFTLPQKTRIYFDSGQTDSQELPGNKLYSRVSGVIGNSLSPTVLFVKGRDEEKKVVSTFDSLIKAKAPESASFSMVLGLSTFIPDAQARKKEILLHMHDKFARLNIPQSDKRTLFLTSLEDSIHVEPVAESNLPSSILRLFVAPHDPNVFAVTLFTPVERTDSDVTDAYRKTIESLRHHFGLSFLVVDSNFVTTDTVNLIKREAPAGLALLVVFLSVVLLAVIPSKKRAVLILSQLLGGLILLSGAMWLFHINLNILNLSAISIILGTGIDSFIHFSHRHDETKFILATVRSKVPSIITSNLTTIVGFGGLMLTSNGGLVSIGSLAVLGLVVITLLAVTVFPQSLALAASKNKF